MNIFLIIFEFVIFLPRLNKELTISLCLAKKKKNHERIHHLLKISCGFMKFRHFYNISSLMSSFLDSQASFAKSQGLIL